MDHARLARTLHACSLNRDVEQLYDGIDTEIGGKQELVSPYSFT